MQKKKIKFEDLLETENRSDALKLTAFFNWKSIKFIQISVEVI